MAMRMPSTSPTPDAATGRAGYFRWTICGLLFVAATINYVDRQVIGLLKPTLQQQFGWSEIDYADIVFSFQLAYAIGFVFAGRVIDQLGTRLGFSLALAIWSAAAIAHAFAPAIGPGAAAVLGFVGLTYTGSVAGFMAVRFALGIGESANFPAAIKTVAEGFPRRERALATGLFHAGSSAPRRLEGGGGVVPEARTRACARHLQRGDQRRRPRERAARAVAHARVRLARSIRRHRRARPVVARGLGAAVRRARQPSARRRRRTRAPQERSRGSA